MADIVSRLQKALGERYSIERELGSGGAGIVFLAEDVRHARKVALKVLRPEIGQSIGAERFLQEIRIAAQLSHPNILSLIDSGEEDGLLYYVMFYVAGESLRDLLIREKQLPVDDAVRLTREAAEALGRPRSYVYARTASGAERPIPHRKMDGTLWFTAGERRHWIRETEVDVIGGPMEGTPEERKIHAVR